MVREDRVIMSVKELRRVHVIRQTMEKTLTQVKAGTLLGLTPRHIRRLLARVAQGDDQGLAHRGRGKPSNRRIPETVKTKALTLYAQRYGDFGPTLAAEKLADRHGIAVHAETLRGWLLAKGVTHFQRRKRPHRAWRERKAQVGELVQLDGSHHDWFEGRGSRCVLMAYIDDASSRVCARFYEYEGTIPAMDSFQRYVTRYGIPLAVYADKHTTYQSPAQPTVDEQLAGVTPTSQFGRALGALGVELIPAHSPQAKGRVERLFKTVQDRLVTELRLAEVRRWRRQIGFWRAICRSTTGALRCRPRRPRICIALVRHTGSWTASCASRRPAACARTSRLHIRGDSIRFHETVRVPHVLVEEHVDGTMRITHQGQTLGFHAITSPPVKAATVKPVLRARQPVTPRPEHPWRRRLRPERQTQATAART